MGLGCLLGVGLVWCGLNVVSGSAYSALGFDWAAFRARLALRLVRGRFRVLGIGLESCGLA